MFCRNWCCDAAGGDPNRDAATARDAEKHGKPWVPFILIALALTGLAVAFYDSYAIYTSQPLWCPPPIDGCNVVAASAYARIFGLPIGYYGLVFYGGMLGLAILLATDPWSPALRAGAVLLAAVGLAFSIYFLVLQVGYIHAFCVYCAVSAMTTLLLAITAVWHCGAASGPGA